MTISEQIKVLCVRTNLSVSELARRMDRILLWQEKRQWQRQAEDISGIGGQRVLGRAYLQ